MCTFERNDVQYNSDYDVFGPGNPAREKREADKCLLENCKNEQLSIPKGYNFFDIPFPPSMERQEFLLLECTN